MQTVADPETGDAFPSVLRRQRDLPPAEGFLDEIHAFGEAVALREAEERLSEARDERRDAASLIASTAATTLLRVQQEESSRTASFERRVSDPGWRDHRTCRRCRDKLAALGRWFTASCVALGAEVVLWTVSVTGTM